MAEKQKYIEWEMENIPGIYSKPKSDQFIDRATLTHVISNVNCPEGVTCDAFYAVINAVAETLEVVPYFKMEDIKDA